MGGYEPNYTPNKRAVLYRHRLPQALQRLLCHRREELGSGARAHRAQTSDRI